MVEKANTIKEMDLSFSIVLTLKKPQPADAPGKSDRQPD